MIYEFGLSQTEGILVRADKNYELEGAADATGYGFLVEENRNAFERLAIPELNSGFDTVYWYRGRTITTIMEDEHGCYADGEQAGRIPCTFVTDVPEKGNYKVTISLYAAEKVEEAFVFLGRRRLAFVGSIEKGTEWKRSFLTNICPIVPRNHAEAMEDTTLDVTVLGKGLHIKRIEIAQSDSRTIYIAGDSTVTDQSAEYPYYPYHSYCGWGQMLSCYTGEEAAISNHSHSGLTTESFRSEGHYGILLNQIAAGDLCLFQFGHNDQKLKHLMADGGYKDNLIRYIDEIRQKGAVPILVTPIARNSWKGNDGTYNDLLIEYADVCKKVAAKKNVLLVDLHQKSKALVTGLGRDAVKAYYFPSDYTHTNDYGAFLYAGYVYEALVDAGVLKGQKEDSYAFIPPKELPEIKPPKGLEDVKDPNAERLFEHLERPDELLTRADALSMVITTMHFFPTNVYNDAFCDVIGHETYAGTVECAYQNGLIPEKMIENNRFFPTRQISGKEFLDIVKTGYQSRKGSLTLDHAMEQMRKERVITRGSAAKICRKLHI